MVAHHSFSRITLAGAVVATTLFAHAPSATTAFVVVPSTPRHGTASFARAPLAIRWQQQQQQQQQRRRGRGVAVRAEGDPSNSATEEAVGGDGDDTPLSSLEKKMQSWEATEEDQKKASLGGLTPGSMDSFDIGLALAFPFIVGTCLLFLLFPFIGEQLASGSRDLPAFEPEPAAVVKQAAPAAAPAPAAVEQAAAPAPAPAVSEAASVAPAAVSEVAESPAAPAGPKVRVTDSGLKIIDLVEGTGATPAVGQTVKVDYTGWLNDFDDLDGKFDSSKDRRRPLSFAVGTGRVIKGWDEGLLDMKVGGKRRLIIPSDIAYGKKGAGGVIPPDSTLYFEVGCFGTTGAKVARFGGSLSHVSPSLVFLQHTQVELLGITP